MKKSLEEMLGELNRIYQEREDQFRKWDQDHEKKKKQLETMLEELARQRKEIEKKQTEIKTSQEEVERQKSELNRREEEFSQLYTELEQVRSEAMKLKMEVENYRFERALQEVESGEADPVRYILRAEHEKIVGEMQNTIDTLRNERIHLLKNSLGISISTEEKEEETSELTLTADVLQNYFDITESGSAEKFVRDGVETVELERNGIHYSFLFTVPPTFMVSAGLLSQEQKEELGRVHPELQISEKDGTTTLTGYFTEDIQAEKLVGLVGGIGKQLESKS